MDGLLIKDYVYVDKHKLLIVAGKGSIKVKRLDLSSI